jgi:hypothetical protein
VGEKKTQLGNTDGNVKSTHLFCQQDTKLRYLKSVHAEILGPVKISTGRRLFWGTATIKLKIKVLWENLVEGDLQEDLKRKKELH